MRTTPGHGCKVDGKLAGWIAITGMKRFTKARSPLYQFTLLTLRAIESRLIRFIDRFCVITFWIMATANEHTKTALA
ncbi:hypothetical protein C7422_11543 [Pantoea ananatis]|nr:hypothetical protein C7422_11543 [Pantoea ananatis]REE57642.1 hypothetical protein C7424_4639 [Pantoea ananatis]REF03361.1 hypothetical protein C7428_4561 [Pantoea ananatis]